MALSWLFTSNLAVSLLAPPESGRKREKEEMRSPNPLAGRTVKLTNIASPDTFNLQGQDYRVEDWWENVAGMSWKDAQGNPACLQYAIRTGFSERSIPIDDEVLYGKVGALGYLVHVSEIGDQT